MNFNFIFKSFILIFLSGLYSITITVGSDSSDDYTTIQDGIDAASDGDIVLVGDGIYNENLIIESEITLTSAGGNQNTVIDGSGATGNMRSTITVRPASGSPTIPQNIEIDGFTVTGGVGNSMNRNDPTFGVVTEILGGGIMAYNTSPKIINNDIKENGGSQTTNGGGIVAVDSAEDWSFNDREYEINPELPPATDDLDFSSNIFYANDANHGHSVFISGFSQHVTKLSNSILDCYSSEYQNTTEYWVKRVDSTTEFDYEGCQGTEPIYGTPDGLIENDVWINPETGEDEGNYIGDIEHPFRTIEFALGMVYPTEENPITIHLQGDITPEFGEDFPIIMMSNIILDGNGHSIGANQTSQVIKVEYCSWTVFKDLIIEGGVADGIYPYNHGGGIDVINSTEILFRNVLIQNNSAIHSGGGVRLWECDNILFEETIIDNNQATNGGGVSIWLSENIYFRKAIIGSNQATFGGGIWSQSSESILQNITLSENVSDYGGIWFSDSEATIINSILWNNYTQSIMLSWEVDDWGDGPSYLAISYSDIDDVEDNNYGEINWLNGNISEDPQFYNGVNLSSNSPCIDAGIADIDGDGIIGNSWYDIDDFYGEAPDMGALESNYNPGQEDPGDLTGDGLINVQDIVLLVNIVLGFMEPIPGSDINGDGTINVIDIVMLIDYILYN